MHLDVAVHLLNWVLCPVIFAVQFLSTKYLNFSGGDFLPIPTTLKANLKFACAFTKHFRLPLSVLFSTYLYYVIELRTQRSCVSVLGSFRLD